MVAAFCRFVGQKCAKNKIPYGFQLPSECLNSQGEWNLGRVGKGLTCATFVLAVFQAQRLDIAQLDDWQPRASDLAWKRKVIEALRARAPEQASYLEANDLECVRYRPEEVAGAAASGKYPAGFQDAADLGNRILDVLKSRALNAQTTPFDSPAPDIESNTP